MILESFQVCLFLEKVFSMTILVSILKLEKTKIKHLMIGCLIYCQKERLRKSPLKDDSSEVK